MYRSAIPALVLLLITAISSQTTEKVTVSLSYGGSLQGKYSSTEKTTSFLGVPYVKPPERWKQATKITSNSGTKEAFAVGKSCIQSGDTSKESEDCLTLNIYIPGKLDPSAPPSLPVMVWIHGGGLIIGAGHYYEGHDIATKGDVIVITINYRLGALGFLFSEDLGNLGFIDQRMALKWVQENIRKFGGDPNKVTIFGESAGGISVSAHVFSKKAKGLFHRAISQSGVLDVMGVSKAKRYESGRKFAKELGCEKPSVSEMIDCLKTKPTKDMVGPQGRLHPQGIGIDEDSVGNVAEMIKNGDYNNVPYIIGTNNMEGNVMAMIDPGFYTVMKTENTSKFLQMGKEKFMEQLLPMFRDSDDRERAASAAFDKYGIAKGKNNTEILANYFKMSGDEMFVHPAFKEANALADKGVKVYMYHLTSGNPQIGNILYKYGAGHADDEVLLWKNLIAKPELVTANDKILSKAMIKAWTDFAKTGDPGISWKPWQSAQRSYLEWRSDPKPGVVREGFKEGYMKFWGNELSEIVKSTRVPPLVAEDNGSDMVTATLFINAVLVMALVLF